MPQSVIILGAGIVGVSCALALQGKGFAVTLVDRRAPGEETSHGNAGVLSRTSLIPLNNPSLLRNLPSLLKNQSAGFRYNAQYLRRSFLWAARFIANARTPKTVETMLAIDALIQLSGAQHRVWLSQAAVGHRMRDTGWLMLYRDAAGFAAGAWARGVYDTFGVGYDVFNSAEIYAREPELLPIFSRAVHVRDAASVDDPGAVVKAYAAMFVQRGGKLLQAEVAHARQSEAGGWNLTNTCGAEMAAQHLVVALGPWSKAFLATLEIKVPMAFERGAHHHFRPPQSKSLQQPIYDVSGGYVLTPTAHGMRLTTGVDLNALDAPINEAQLAIAEANARAAFPLGARVPVAPWQGARPTLPDSRPAIGASSRRRHLWCAFGHQHIGFSTGPGTGALLAALMTGEPPEIAAAPFSPQRFRI